MRFLLRRSSLLTAAAALVAVLIGENVPAQPNPPPSVAPAPRIKLTAEQEYIIREIISHRGRNQKEGVGLAANVRLIPLAPGSGQVCDSLFYGVQM
jgi:hypothetical protein